MSWCPVLTTGLNTPIQGVAPAVAPMGARILEHYDPVIHCANCGEEVHLKIGVGTSISRFTEEMECPMCGCVGYLG